MIRTVLAPVLLAAPLAMAGGAHAASTGWQDTEGARLRLVVDDRPAPDGTLRGALEIALAPGWKTYWREPGDAGVPPRLTLDGSSNADGVSMHFPAPERFTDEWSTWAGYRGSMAIALEFATGDPAQPVLLKTSAFLGICEDICIPVQMSFMLETNPDAPADEPAVAAAFAALPAGAHDGFTVTQARLEGEVLVVEAEVPGNAAGADLFLAPADGWLLDVPERSGTEDGRATFHAKVLSSPGHGALPVTDYTLVNEGEAVSGRFTAR